MSHEVFQNPLYQLVHYEPVQFELAENIKNDPIDPEITINNDSRHDVNSVMNTRPISLSKLKLIRFLNICLCQIVRLAFLAEAGFCIYLMATLMKSNLFYILTILLCVIVVDGFYVASFRDGKEYTW
jgi:hypothetical protein